MANHSSVLAWEIRGQRSLAGYTPWGRKSQTRLSNETTTTVAEAETPIFQLPDAKSQLIGKDPSTGKDRSQKEKGDSR